MADEHVDKHVAFARLKADADERKRQRDGTKDPPPSLESNPTPTGGPPNAKDFYPEAKYLDNDSIQRLERRQGHFKRFVSWFGRLFRSTTETERKVGIKPIPPLAEDLVRTEEELGPPKPATPDPNHMVERPGSDTDNKLTAPPVDSSTEVLIPPLSPAPESNNDMVARERSDEIIRRAQERAREIIGQADQRARDVQDSIVLDKKKAETDAEEIRRNATTQAQTLKAEVTRALDENQRLVSETKKRAQAIIKEANESAVAIVDKAKKDAEKILQDARGEAQRIENAAHESEKQTLKDANKKAKVIITEAQQKVNELMNPATATGGGTPPPPSPPPANPAAPGGAPGSPVVHNNMNDTSNPPCWMVLVKTAFLATLVVVLLGFLGYLAYNYLIRDQDIIHKTSHAAEAQADAQKAIDSAHRAEADAAIRVAEAKAEAYKYREERIVHQPYAVLVAPRTVVDLSTSAPPVAPTTTSPAPPALKPPTPSTTSPAPPNTDQPRGSMDNRNPSGCRHHPHEHCACVWLNVQQLPPRITVFPGNFHWSPGPLRGNTYFQVEGVPGWWSNDQ